MTSLYETIGGANAVAVVVDAFYGRVLADPVLSPYFQRSDLRRLKGHQRAFITAALGGPDIYRGRDLSTVHAGMGIAENAFDRVVHHLAATLQTAGVADDVIDQIADRLEPLRSVVTAVPA